MFEYSPKKHTHMAKNPVYEIKHFSIPHFTVAQPQLVLNLFLNFDQFGGSCSYKIVFIKKEGNQYLYTMFRVLDCNVEGRGYA